MVVVSLLNPLIGPFPYDRFYPRPTTGVVEEERNLLLLWSSRSLCCVRVSCSTDAVTVFPVSTGRLIPSYFK